MPRPSMIVLIIGILTLGIASLFVFGIVDGFSPVQKPEPIKIMNTTKKTTNTEKLKIEDIKVGNGKEVKNGDTVVINYLGTLPDGTKFDSSYDRGEPFETQIGIGRVIKGWDIGVVGMKVGGKRKLTIPPSLGYGQQTVGSIPANSTLIFEVELVDVK